MSQVVERARIGAAPGVNALAFFGRIFQLFRQWPVIHLVILVGLAVLAIFGPAISQHDPLRGNLRDRNTPPVWTSEGSSTHLLGTDNVGRDVFSRVAHGARISLLVAGIALVVGTVVGTILGLVAGYFGGMVDEVIMRIVDIWFALPFLLLALLIAVVIGASQTTVMGLLVLLVWASFVRYVRAEVLTLKERDYVALAKVAGASTPRILFRHILPGVINTVIVIATLRSGQLVLAEASLSFLGAGIPPPTATWGIMISDGRQYLQEAWWISVFPGLAIFLLVYALNFLGDWMRDHFDPRLRQVQRGGGA